MFFKLEPNKSYAILFFIIGGISLFSYYVFGKTISGLVFALAVYYLGFLQLNSGIAFNGRWVAKYKEEDHPFLFYICVFLSFALGTFGLITVFFSS